MKRYFMVGVLFLFLSLTLAVSNGYDDRVTVPQYYDVGNDKLVASGSFTVVDNIYDENTHVVGYDTATHAVMVYRGTATYHIGQVWYRA